MGLLVLAIFLFLIHSSSTYDSGYASSQTECRLWNYWPCRDDAEECLEEPNVEKRMCIRPAKLASTCNENADCRAIKNAKCSENGTCICQHDYLATDGHWPCTKKRTPDSEKLKAFNMICLFDKCEQPEDNSWIVRRIGQSELLYGENCTNDDDCKRYNLDSTACIKRQCRCRPGHIFAYEESTCRPSQNGLGLNCTKERKCEAQNSYCDDFNKCRCKPLHYYKDGGCVLDPSYNCPNDYYFNQKTQLCTRNAHSLGDYCFNDESCIHLLASKCFNGMCLCPSDTMTIDGACIKPLYYSCQISEDCTVPNSDCRFKRCVCNYGYYESNNRTKCLVDAKKLQDTCENNEACSGIRNSHCNGTNCVCHNAIEKNGICFPLIGGRCHKTMPCQSVNSKCLDGKCVCADRLGPLMLKPDLFGDTYYISDDKSACLLYAKNLGDSCKALKGCERVGHHIACLEGKCVCDVGYRNFRGTCVGTNGSRCYRDSDCWNGFKCLDEVCTCPSKTGQGCADISYNDHNEIEQCPHNFTGIGQFCYHDESCACIKGSKCINFGCQCPGNTTYHYGVCVLQISSYCSKSEDCNVPDSICIQGRCECTEDFYASYNKLQCLPLARRANDPCSYDAGCRNVEWSRCEDAKCTCSTALPFETDGICTASSGESCNLSQTCRGSDKVCKNGSCECIDGYFSISESRSLTCHKNPKKLGDKSLRNIGCMHIGRYVSFNGEICVCSGKYREIDGNCFGTNQADCYEDSDCAEDFKCVKKVCSCPEYAVLMNNGSSCLANPLRVACRRGYYYYLSEDRCLPYAQKIGDFCSPKDNCDKLNLNYTECKFSTCQCHDEYVFSNGSCVISIGGYCDKYYGPRVCDAVTSECTYHDGCQCKSNYVPSSDGLVCVHSS